MGFPQCLEDRKPWMRWRGNRPQRSPAPACGSLTDDLVPFSGGQPVLLLHHHLPVRGPGHLRRRRALLPHAGDLVSAPPPPHPTPRCSQMGVLRHQGGGLRAEAPHQPNPSTSAGWRCPRPFLARAPASCPSKTRFSPLSASLSHGEGDQGSHQGLPRCQGAMRHDMEAGARPQRQETRARRELDLWI